MERALMRLSDKAPNAATILYFVLSTSNGGLHEMPFAEATAYAIQHGSEAEGQDGPLRQDWLWVTLLAPAFHEQRSFILV